MEGQAGSGRAEGADPPKTAKQKALDDWLGKVNARYAALDTGKKLSQSFNYSYVERVIEHGDLGALDYLKANRYVDDALESEAKAALKAGDGFDPADEAAYKKALRSYKNNSTRYARYLSEWRESTDLCPAQGHGRRPRLHLGQYGARLGG